MYLPAIPAKACDQQEATESVRVQPLFPGYLFVRFDPFQTSIRKIVTLSSISQAVKTCGVLSSVELALVRELRKRCSMVLESASKTIFCSGDRVTVKDGPFAQVDAIFSETVGSKRCKLLLEMLAYLVYIDRPIQPQYVGNQQHFLHCQTRLLSCLHAIFGLKAQADHSQLIPVYL